MFPSFSLRYAQLPARMSAECDPTPVAAPRLVAFNHALAGELGFDAAAFDAGEAAEALSGNAPPAGSAPLAMAYAGHQFGNFVPRLGDGRALLLGEVIDRGGQLRELQLKGAGRTPFSRGGDGRAPLGPVLREYLVSEAMHALGIPTTRALAAVTTGERVLRRLPEPGAVLTRVAGSHLRVGTFQYFAARRDVEAIQLLADMAIERHYPHLEPLSGGGRYLALLEAVIARQAELVARWMGVGFIHGVMNTDNTTISGETLDYGPCAFMDVFEPRTVFSSIDERGRYAFSNQPHSAQWNLARFAETLLSLLDDDHERAVALATDAIEAFPEHFEASWGAVKRAKLGLSKAEEGDEALAQELLDAMQAGHADYTLTFRRLADVLDVREGESDGREGPVSDSGEARLVELFDSPEAITAWLSRWRDRLAREDADAEAIAARLRATNPAVIPRNHLVEQALTAAIEHDDFGPFEALLAVVTRPFEAPDEGEVDYTRPPEANERVLRTFCGT
ncbi:protein adenylyltransferase SelO [Halomonas sp. YLGW01]|uniref:protein adenylyltransferase SelO n=1 Tax=Halomonas sp. YLGW01 TaxID=2773308 RepID=UPI00177EB0CC|nr:YdiU family protein [Halomonas sp. YLGW01]